MNLNGITLFNSISRIKQVKWVISLKFSSLKLQSSSQILQICSHFFILAHVFSQKWPILGPKGPKMACFWSKTAEFSLISPNSGPKCPNYAHWHPYSGAFVWESHMNVLGSHISSRKLCSRIWIRLVLCILPEQTCSNWNRTLVLAV